MTSSPSWLHVSITKSSIPHMFQPPGDQLGCACVSDSATALLHLRSICGGVLLIYDVLVLPNYNKPYYT